MIKLENVNQTIAKRKILSSISIDLKPGFFYALIGANGAGKSTLIKTILGAYPRDVENSKIILGNQQDNSGKNIFSYIPEWEIFCKNQKVLSFLLEVGRFRKIPKQELLATIEENLKKFNLIESKKVKIKNLSSGMRKKLLFIAAFLHNPKVIILDEPFANLDPPTKLEIINFLNEEKRNKLTALISSHMLSDIEPIIDHVFFIENGKIKEQNLSDKNNYVVIVTKNLSLLCQYLKDSKITYESDGVSKIYFKALSKKVLEKIISNIYKLKDNGVSSIKINDLEQKYFEKYLPKGGKI